MSFWTDPKVSDDFTPEDKYFYLYLLTNPHTNICGCYELSIRQMSIETGYSRDTIEKLLDRMERIHDVIRYSSETKEILIINWPKYNWSQSPKVKKSIEDSMTRLKHQEYKAFLSKCFEHIDTISIGYQYHTNTTFSLGIGIGIGNGIGSISNEANSKSDEKKRHLAEVEDFFESIWKLYIRKEGKNAVTKAAKEEIFSVGYERMKACIEKYSREKEGCDKQYILMGSTFFNGRYKDYLEDEQPKVVDTPEPTAEELEEKEWEKLSPDEWEARMKALDMEQEFGWQIEEGD